MNTGNKQSSSRYKGFGIVLIPAFILTLIFAYNPSSTVLADNEPQGGEEIKEMVFGTNFQEERSSRRPKLVTIKKGEHVYKVLTLQTDVNDILDEYKIPVDGDERIVVSTEYVADGSLVRVIKTETVIDDVLLDVPFQQSKVETNKYVKGEEHITQEGVLGVRKQRVQNYYEDGVLVDSQIIFDKVIQEPRTQILEIGTSEYSLVGIDPKGYNCPYWYSVVDSGPYSEEEKRWMKFIMYCESGCNAESNKSSYKGLFQWSPYWWSKQFPENIFDGYAQIKHTIEKYRAGESTRVNQWPACHAKYNRTFGIN